MGCKSWAARRGGGGVNDVIVGGGVPFSEWGKLV